MNYLGDYPVNATVYVPFHTFNSVGASVTITGLAVTDIEIYKDGSATQRSSDVGYTLLDGDGTDFDGLTGIHGFSIDTSDNSDAGFYAAGHEYWVAVSAVTCDSQTVSFVAATFSIERAGGALALIKALSTDAEIADAVLDEAVDGTDTLRQLVALMAAVLLGKASGGGTGTVTFRDVNDTANRVVATLDASGNRSAVTLTAP